MEAIVWWGIESSVVVWILIFFRLSGAWCEIVQATHSLRCGLHCFAASRLLSARARAMKQAWAVQYRFGRRAQWGLDSRRND